MYPRDTYTIHIYNDGATTSRTILATSSDTYTILGLSFTQSAQSSDTYIMCDGAVVAHNFALTIPWFPLNYICSGRLYLDKTGNDMANIEISYVQRNRMIVPDPPLWFATSTAQYASTTQSTAQSFIASYGQFTLMLCGVLIVIAIMKALYDLWASGGSMKI